MNDLPVVQTVTRVRVGTPSQVRVIRKPVPIEVGVAMQPVQSARATGPSASATGREPVSTGDAIASPLTPDSAALMQRAGNSARHLRTASKRQEAQDKLVGRSSSAPVSPLSPEALPPLPASARLTLHTRRSPNTMSFREQAERSLPSSPLLPQGHTREASGDSSGSSFYCRGLDVETPEPVQVPLIEVSRWSASTSGESGRVSPRSMGLVAGPSPHHPQIINIFEDVRDYFSYGTSASTSFELVTTPTSARSQATALSSASLRTPLAPVMPPQAAKTEPSEPKR